MQQKRLELDLAGKSVSSNKTHVVTSSTSSYSETVKSLMLKVDDINIRYGMNIRVYAGKSLPGMARFCHHFQEKRKKPAYLYYYYSYRGEMAS